MYSWRIAVAAASLGWLAAAVGVGAQGSPDASWSLSPVGVLPLQDRVGEPRLAAVVEDALIQALAESHGLADPVRLRDAQRRLRLRDAGQAAPDDLARLGELTGTGWFFSATLHQVTSGRSSRAAQAFSGRATGPVPQIILSARVVRVSAGAAELDWAGFEAASGLDGRRLLGLGVIGDPEPLALAVAHRLIESFERDLAQEADRLDARPAGGGYLRRPIDAGATIAVVPFQSVTRRDATVAAETVTELALAALHRGGAKLMLPAMVNDILRRRGSQLRGEVDAGVRADLRERGAELILTGAVETWELRGRGTEPEPRIGFSARLLDAESGAILWWNGQERSGWDRSRGLGLGRVHAAGVLAEEIMSSLVASFMEPKR